MNKKIWGGIALSIVIVVIAFAVINVRDHSQNLGYRIGVVLPLTGRAATYGERSLNGISLAADQLNSTTPFTDYPIKLIVEDSQSKATHAVSSFRKLVDIDKVPVVVGLLTSDEALSCAPVAEQTKTVLFSPGAASTKLKDAGDYIFRNRESTDLQAKAIAKACIERSGRNGIAVLHANAANAVSYRDSFIKAVEDIGGNVLGVVAFNEGKTDYRAEIEQLRALNPKAVYLAGYDTELGIILKQCKEVGFAVDFYASAGAVSKKLLEIAKEGAEGLVCATAPFEANSQDPHIKAFVSSFEERYGKSPDWLAANSYDAIQILASILKKGAKTAEQIKEGLYATKNYPGVAGITTFDEYGEVIKPITIVIVKNGSFLLQK